MTKLAWMSALLLAGAASAQERQGVERYNTVLGTQTIGAAYQFTTQPKIVETAQAILDMGANVLKLNMSRDFGSGKNANVPAPSPAIHTLTELARDEPAHKKVLDMPFQSFIIWAYPFTGGWWDKGLSAQARDREYREMRDFAAYLLQTYSGTGKRFYLGHWEGDWHLRSGYDTRTDDKVTPAAVQGMSDWLNIRQKAIDDAKHDTPHRDVEVYCYTEVNLVALARQGRRTVTNDVLPKTNVDYVSYSSYDTQAGDLKGALDYIESKLPPKPGIAGKRVFIGEYGFPAEQNPPAQQEERSRRVMREGLAWGCPFVLYGELYNNEVTGAGKQRGFWLIDDKGVKQPVYDTHQRFYRWAREYLADFQAKHGCLPEAAEFGKAGAEFLAEGAK